MEGLRKPSHSLKALIEEAAALEVVLNQRPSDPRLAEKTEKEGFSNSWLSSEIQKEEKKFRRGTP